MYMSCKQYIPLLTALLVLLAGLTLSTPVFAQNVDAGSINFKQLHASDLSNQQLKQLWKRAQEQGRSLQDIKKVAVLRGMSPIEAAKLVQRVKNLKDQMQSSNQPLQQPGQLRS